MNPEPRTVIAGGVTRAKKFRDGLRSNGVDCTFAMIIKERLQANQVAGVDLVGSVDGKARSPSSRTRPGPSIGGDRFGSAPRAASERTGGERTTGRRR